MKTTYPGFVIPGLLILAVLTLVMIAGAGSGQAQTQAADLVVTNSVNPESVAPGEMVIYTVTLSNTTGTPLEVSSLLDTLPDDFEYVGLAPNCENPLGQPDDAVPPEIGWTQPFPLEDTATVCYKVHVPDTMPLSPDPYLNEVVATIGDDTYAAQAGLLVAIGDVTVAKEVAPERAAPGDLVTYTVTFDNNGYVPVPLAVVTDVLPAGVTWVAMTGGSDVAAPPDGVEGAISWAGPFDVSPAGLVVEYQAALPLVTETMHLVNEAAGRLVDGTVLPSAGAEVVVSTGASTLYLPFTARGYRPAAFLATKSADPEVGFTDPPGTPIAYTVTFDNDGAEEGILAEVRDVLPAGFTFVSMLPGSDVADAPTGTTGEIVWEGPFPVPGGSSLTLIYQVRATTIPGTYVNSATATTAWGRPPQAPATATVRIQEPIFLEEEFENPSPYWTEFLNYWRLNDEQWYYNVGGSDNGSTALAHSYWRGVNNPVNGAHDALIMYKEPAANGWTDYAFQARAVLFSDDGTNRGQFGMWFRGYHEDHPDSGQYVEGYYFVLKPGPPTRAYLMQLRTPEECGDDCTHNYNFSNPIGLIELEGDDDLRPLGLDIKKGVWYWLRVEVEGPRIRCFINGIQVIDYYDNVGTTFLDGTVGFYTYIAGDARFDHVTVEPWP